MIIVPPLSRTSRNQTFDRMNRIYRIKTKQNALSFFIPYILLILSKKAALKAAPVLDLRYILVTNCDDLTDK
ncbi:MAG: hypothetical protein A2V79_07415 [Betaproteobacteria bacterium RBG_16_56_24]|nr:MAG: hypothetical protein A2V79_07415 [Betaproteobacteria bacterium RBG_16_56_24]